MKYKKMNGYIKLIIVVTVIAFVFAIIMGFKFFLSVSKEKKVSNEKAPKENISVQQDTQDFIEQSKSDDIDNTFKYMTFSQNGNIDIIVNYLNPVIGTNDVLTFEVSLGTHSVSLSKYEDIRRYIELTTDSGIVVSEEFEWVLQNAEDHHINGILKIKNDFDGKLIVGEDTKLFKLVFKDIPDTSEREHIYEGEKLK